MSELQIQTRKNNQNKMGRPKGAKNKTTLFKEAMREGFEDRLIVDGEKVFNAVVTAALDGDMVAAKMIMDRIVPVVDTEKVDAGKFQISINVQGVEPSVDIIDGEIIKEEE